LTPKQQNSRPICNSIHG